MNINRSYKMKIKSLIALIILSLFSSQYGWAREMMFDDEASLISPDTQVNYNTLANFLAQEQWRKANDETRILLLEATGRKDIGWSRAEDIQSLSCWDLETIDQLWQKYSEGKFGFSSQLPIYLETGNRPGKLVSDNAYNVFGDRLGWRTNDDWIIFIENLNYSIDAPKGHFPNPRPEYTITGGRLYYSVLAQRMVDCKLVKDIPQKVAPPRDPSDYYVEPY